MKNLLTLSLQIVIGIACCAQDSLAIKYANTINQEELKKHLYEIASDEYQGRETGYVGQQMCEEYLVNFYKENNLPPINGTYTQEFKLSLDDPSKVYVNTADKNFEFLEDYYYYPSTGDRKISGDLYYTGYGITDKKYTDINILNIEGKVVLVWDGEPLRDDGNYKVTGTKEPSNWTKDTEKKRKLVEEAGAAALFIIHPDYDVRKEQVSKYFSHQSMSLYNENGKVKSNMPIFHISPKMAEGLMGAKSYKKAKKLKAKHKIKPVQSSKVNIEFARGSKILTSTNVLGYIEGTDLKDELVVITAHYDHIGVDGEVYNGADDDGSGTVATMEIAQAFAIAKKEGHGPRRSVMIINVSGEEKGLLGSQFYVENPVFPLENTVADLNIDMIGRVDEQHEGNENYVYLIGADRLSQDLHDVGEKVNKLYTNIELDYTFNAEDDPNRFYYRSDHYNFAKNNVPSVFFFSGVHEDYHKPGDTVDKIMFPKLTRITKLIFHTAWEIANQDKRLELNN